jgi:hypothetical protein
MIENINELAKFVKGGADVLQKAIESEEKVSIEFIEGSFVSDNELETMKESIKGEYKREFNAVGYDHAVKDFKKDFGIDIEGKDRKAIVDAVKKNILDEAKIEPSKKINELEASLSNLQATYDNDISAKDNEINSYRGKIKDISIMSELQRNTPEVKGLSANQFATLARTEFQFDFDDNNTLIAKKNGQPIKDKMERNIPVKDILTDYATQNGWFGSPGRGGDHQSGSGSSEFKTINDVYKHMEQNRIDPMSPEGEKLLNEFKEN